MPDNNEFANTAGQADAQSSSSSSVDAKILDSLNRLNKSIDALNASIHNMSQSNARDDMYDNGSKFRKEYREHTSQDRTRRTVAGIRSGKSQSFSDAFSDAFFDGLVSNEFKSEVRKQFQDLAKGIGLDLQDASGSFGKQLGDYAANAIKNSKIGSAIQGRLQNAVLNTFSRFNAGFVRGVGRYDFRHNTEFQSQFNRNVSAPSAANTASGTSSASPGSVIANQITNSIASQAGSKIAGQAAAGATGTIGGGAMLSGIAGGIMSVAPQAALLLAFDKLTEAIGPVIKGLGAFIESLKVTSQRYEESRRKNLEAAQKRLEADIRTVITKPFEILEEAANKVYDTWDSSLRTITATQGYSKADVQDLMAQYANRLRSEGLSDVIPGTDIVSNLTKVLQAGLSGAVAEEFAYQATLLENLIPTQDFFSYASDYASIAANAVRVGKSQEAAISEANQQLKSFANSALYASRATGGFTTGLQNAQDLFNKAVKISQAAKVGDASQIAGVFTSVAATVGAIAPDLASSITDAVYNAAVGGNDSRLVALRSLAGVNASNTEFLQALAKDPQKIFSTLFEKLAYMYSDSSDAYMEKAEGYGELFGLSAEAFQRIDFNYLAQAISQMNSSSDALSENMSLLQSGQTTLTAEQLKTREINKYMIEEGLAYVMDNEAARAIQQHMWDEQIARELQETTYGIELKGHSLELLEGIVSTAKKIMSLFNPLAWGKSVANIAATQAEEQALEIDIAQILERGKVGKGNTRDYNRLVTRNVDLQLTKPLAELLGGSSVYAAQRRQTQAVFQETGQASLVNKLTDQATAAANAMQDNTNAVTSTPTSKYSWGSISKSQYAAIVSSAKASTAVDSTAEASQARTAPQQSQTNLASIFKKVLSDEYLGKFINQKEPKTYEDWVKSTKSLGIADFEKAVSDVGYTESQLRDYFESKEVEAGQNELQRQQQKEETLWDTALNFYTKDFPEDFRDPLMELLDAFKNDFSTFNQDFLKYSVDVTTKLDDLSRTAEAIRAAAATFYDVEFRQNYRQKLFETLDTQSSALYANLGQVITSPIVSSIEKSFGELKNEFKNGQAGWITKWNAFLNTGDNSWNNYSKMLRVFTTAFSNYFIEHKTYDTALKSSGGYSKLEKIKQTERNGQGDAIYALADVLTKNTTDLRDPTVQTNALLAQILQVVSTIMNQTNDGGGGATLADTLSALALGITKKS